MSENDEKARRARADRLRALIEDPDAEEQSPPSPREFVEERMRAREEEGDDDPDDEERKKQ
jgi:hypothetical protein